MFLPSFLNRCTRGTFFRILICFLVVIGYSIDKKYEFFTFISTAAPPKPASLVVLEGHWETVTTASQTTAYEFVERSVARPPLTIQSWRQCVSDKKLLYVGNSHLRDMLKHSLLYLNYPNGFLSHRLKMSTKGVTPGKHHSFTFDDPEYLNFSARLLFAQTRRGLYDQIEFTRYNEDRYHVVFAYTGVFQLFFADFHPIEAIALIRDFFKIVLREFRGDKYVFVNLYDVHQNATKNRKAACFHPKRVKAYQHMIRCVIETFMRQEQTLLNKSTIHYMDVSAITKNANNMSYDGHHYEPGTLSGTPPLQAMLRILQDSICGSPTPHTYSKEPPMACLPPEDYPCYLQCRCPVKHPKEFSNAVKVQHTCTKAQPFLYREDIQKCYFSSAPWKTIANGFLPSTSSSNDSVESVSMRSADDVMDSQRQQQVGSTNETVTNGTSTHVPKG